MIKSEWETNQTSSKSSSQTTLVGANHYIQSCFTFYGRITSHIVTLAYMYLQNQNHSQVELEEEISYYMCVIRKQHANGGSHCQECMQKIKTNGYTIISYTNHNLVSIGLFHLLQSYGYQITKTIW